MLCGVGGCRRLLILVLVYPVSRSLCCPVVVRPVVSFVGVVLCFLCFLFPPSLPALLLLLVLAVVVRWLPVAVLLLGLIRCLIPASRETLRRISLYLCGLGGCCPIVVMLGVGRCFGVWCVLVCV